MKIRNCVAALFLILLASNIYAIPILDGGWFIDEIAVSGLPSNDSPYVFALTSGATFSLTDILVVGDTFTVTDNVLGLILTTTVGVGGSAFGDNAEADSAWVSGL